MCVPSTYHEGVTLSRENLNGVGGDGLCLDTVRLDDGEVMAIDAEHVVGVARQRYQAEAVAINRRSAPPSHLAWISFGDVRTACPA